MSKLKHNAEFVPLRVFIHPDDAMELHARLSRARLSKGKTKTRDISRLLTGRAKEWIEKPFIQIPLPVPVGNKAELMLYLRLWHHIRSPTFPHWRGFQVGDVEPHIVDRCRAHIQRLLELHRHKPALGWKWSMYLKRGVDALDEPAYVARSRKYWAERFANY